MKNKSMLCTETLTTVLYCSYKHLPALVPLLQELSMSWLSLSGLAVAGWSDPPVLMRNNKLPLGQTTRHQPVAGDLLTGNDPF